MSISDKLTTIAENQQKVYDAGADAEHKAFWHTLQTGKGYNKYTYAFYGAGWTNDNFKPIYDICPTEAYQMFCWSNISGDLTEILSDLKIKLDLSKASTVYKCFAATEFTRIGEVDTRSAGTVNSMFFESSKLETIDKLMLKNDGSQTFKMTFGKCNALKNLTVEGVIGGTTFDMRYCTSLSKDSICSVIEAVSTTKTTKITLSQSAVVKAFGSVSDTEWLNLKNTRPKCTVVLA